jgi:23S rRNA (adenine2503-C2)-methyltransferase
MLPQLAGQTQTALQAWLSAQGLPAFRAKQVFGWLHKRRVRDPRLMTNLPQALRESLAAAFDCAPLKVAATETAADGTCKLGYTTRRGNPVEAVLMPGFDYGATVCLSTHSGCALGCRFCATGYLGLKETLSAGQILEQLYLAEDKHGAAADRVVLMGMGEPLHNLDAVGQAVAILTDDAGRGWSPRRITLSTVGLPGSIKLLERAKLPPLNFALSLHFTTAAARQRHMPHAEAALEPLSQLLAWWHNTVGGKVTVEFALLAGLNDGHKDAMELADFCWQVRNALDDGTPVHVNLLGYNPIPQAREYRPAGDEALDTFAGWLTGRKVSVTVRRSRGREISAACGQLGAKLGGG